MIKNEKGAVLVLTLTFALAFLLLGFGSIHYAFVQSDLSEKGKASSAAFWIADGDIERAYDQLVTSSTLVVCDAALAGSPNIYTYEGNHDYCSEAISCPPTCAVDDPYYIANGVCPCVSWGIKSFGTVNNQSRAIYAKVGEDFGSYDIKNAIETHGTVNDLPKPEDKTLPCEKNMNMHIFGGCVENSDFTFEKVFDMTTADKVDFLATRDNYYDDPNSSAEIPVISGLTVIDVTSNCSININTANQVPKLDPDTGDILYDTDGNFIAQGSFLYVDTTKCSGGNISVSFEGDVVFRGIIWIVGEAKIAGTGDIYGAVFVDGALDGSEDMDVNGAAEVYFDPTAIADAINGTSLGSGGGGGGGSLVFGSWKEISLGLYDNYLVTVY